MKITSEATQKDFNDQGRLLHDKAGFCFSMTVTVASGQGLHALELSRRCGSGSECWALAHPNMPKPGSRECFVTAQVKEDRPRSLTIFPVLPNLSAKQTLARRRKDPQAGEARSSGDLRCGGPDMSELGSDPG